MSAYSIAVIMILLCIVLVFQGYKKFSLNNLDRAMGKKDYDLVVQLADMSSTRKAVGDYLCDLYKIRAYFLKKDVPNFEKQLTYMINTTYKSEDKKREFLELYYHTFLIKKNRKYADILLAAIKASNDADFIVYNEQAYEIMLDQRFDLISTMDKEIDSKKYYGFPLGVIVYMMAMQFLYQKNYEQAKIYFQNAITCFHPKAIYVPLANEHIQKIESHTYENQ